LFSKQNFNLKLISYFLFERYLVLTSAIILMQVIVDNIVIDNFGEPQEEFWHSTIIKINCERCFYVFLRVNLLREKRNGGLNTGNIELRSN